MAQMDENLQAAVETQLSFRSWDYLMQLETIDDVPGVGIGTGKSLIRHIADLDKNIQVLVVYSSVEDTSKDNKGREIKKKIEASKTKGDTTSFFKSDGSKYSTKDSIYESMSYFHIPDFRGIGLMTFPTSFASPDSEKSVFGQLNNLKIMKADYTSSIIKTTANIKLVAEMAPDRSGKSPGRLADNFGIDLERFVSTGFNRDWIKSNSQTNPIEMHVCKWSDFNNTPVPVSVQAFNNTLYTPPDRDIKKVVAYERVTQVKYHWLSVNDDVSDSISNSDISDRVKSLEMVDYERLGASHFSDGDVK